MPMWNRQPDRPDCQPREDADRAASPEAAARVAALRLRVEAVGGDDVADRLEP